MQSAESKPDTAAQAGQIPQLPVHFLTTDFPPSHGGLEKYSAQLAANLEAICEVSAGLDSASPPLPLAAKAEPIRWHWHKGRSRLKAGLWSARDCLQSPRPHGARLHMQWNTALVSAIERRAGRLKRLYVCVHGAEIMQLNAGLSALLRFVLAQADAVVTGSHFTAGLLQELGFKTRQTVINPYGVEIPDRSVTPPKHRHDDTLKLLCVHRLVVRKGTALLLEALSRHRGENWQLTLAGDGPETERLKSLCRELGLEKQVLFLGRIGDEEKSALYRQADLFILPSLAPVKNDHIEGLGLGLLEAQAHGLPVLAAQTGGIPEALKDGVTGWLFKPGSCDDLGASLGHLIKSNHEDRAALRLKLADMGKAGAAFVTDHFSWEQNFSRWRELFASR